MSHGLAWGQTWAPATTGWQLTTRAMGRGKKREEGVGGVTVTTVV